MTEFTQSNTLQHFVDALEIVQAKFNLNIQLYDNAIWRYSDGEFTINTDGNQDDLFDGDGNTYSFDVRYGGEKSDDGWVVFYDADNGCGTRDTIIVRAEHNVLAEREVNYD